MFKKALFVLFFLLLPSIAFAEVHIVATLPTLAALAKEIAEPNAVIEQLASNAEDPHFVNPRPDYILKVSRADLLIYNGMELEIGWLPAIQKNARNAKVMDGESGALDASKYIQPLDVPTGKVDRSMGDIHAQGNPHYLYALPNAILVAGAIADRLSNLDPEHREGYQQRLKAFISKANEIDKKWKSKADALAEADRTVAAYHDSMIYLCSWLSLKQTATIESKPGVAPGPSHVAKLTAQLKAAPVHAILQESYQPRATSDKIAQLTKTKVVIIKPGPSPKQTYFEYIEEMLANLF